MQLGALCGENFVFNPQTSRYRLRPLRAFQMTLLEMELIDGESLAVRIKRERPRPVAEVAQFAIQIARGSDAPHRRPMNPRKPE